MTVAEIRNMVMFQTNNDADDLGDFMPHLMHYINEGYELLLDAFKRTGEKLLMNAEDIPQIPHWAHRAIADYATWLVYRNGNAQKQQRGYAFRSAFEEVQRLARETASGRVEHFINIPR